VSDTFTETADATAISRAREDRDGVPGVLLVFSAGEPLHGALRLEQGRLDIGRGRLADVELRDACMSRRHASILRSGDSWTVIDHGSRNGTHVDGERISQQVAANDFSVVRVGETLFLLCPDLAPFVARQVEVREGVVVGPRLDALLSQVMRAAHAGVLHITGETGAGKEIVARFFHRLGAGPAAPFVAVNCAAIPEGVAERLLFGTKRGAFSGASADAAGYIEEANGGTLFLDEVGELDLNVQAKLLRVLETREVLPLGASRPRRVDIRVCSATHLDLREAVSAGRFRSDLFYRLGRPRVVLPPLRQRREEIPYLVDRQLRECGKELIAQAALVETCLLRRWPGNVRELLAEVRDAAFEAQTAGKHVVRLSDLAADAGASCEAGSSPGPEPATQARPFPERHEVERALRECQGRVATAARKLGIHRTQLRRYLDRNRAESAATAESAESAGPATTTGSTDGH
jgi:transcriptional regulator of acetoin/glycerol metabolism